MVVALGLLNVGQWYYRQYRINTFHNTADSKKITEIEHYLDSIGSNYTNQVKNLAEANKLPSWGWPQSQWLRRLPVSP